MTRKEQLEARLAAMDREQQLKSALDAMNPMNGNVRAQGQPMSSDVPVSVNGVEPMQGKPKQQPSTLDQINQSLQGVRGLGEGFTNAMGYLGQSVVNPVQGLMGMEKTRYQPMKTGSGPGYEIPAAVGRGILGVALSPASMAGRAVAGAGLGAGLNPENPMAGGAEGLLYSFAGETIPGLTKGIGAVADKYTRSKYSKEMMDSLAKNYESARDKAVGYLEPLIDKYGSKEVSTEAFSNIVDTANEYRQYLTGGLKKSYNKFLNDPTIENAQRYQSHAGNKIRSIKGKDSTSINEIEALEELRDKTLDGLKTSFDEIGPGNVDDYNQFRKEYAQNVSPYINNKGVSKIANGATFGKSPQDLQRALAEAIQSSQGLPMGHPMRQQLQDLTANLDRSKLYNLFSPFPLAKHFNYNFIEDVAQNPQLEKGLRAIDPYFRRGASGVSSSALSPDNNLIGMTEMMSRLMQPKAEKKSPKQEESK